MAREVVDLLYETQRNLIARRMKPAADAIGRGIFQIFASEEARQKAEEAAAEIRIYQSQVDGLRRTIAGLQQELVKARAEIRQAAIPMEEAQAMARSEVRDLLRPFLTEGDQGLRMLARTIKASLDQAWGKEDPNSR